MVLVNSYYSRESVYKAYGIPARVNYLGVDTERFKPLNLPRERAILSVGTLLAHKRHDFVIEATSFIEPTLRPRVVVVANRGNAPEKLFLENVASARGVRVEILSDVSEQQLVEQYNTVQVVACAQQMEPFGLVALEAMACGTPVVAVKEAGLRETVLDGETGFLVDRVMEGFASAIKRLLIDEKLRREMGNRGREYVCRQWRWEDSVGQLERHFASVL